MKRKRVRLSDEGEGHRRRDPDEAEIEIDAANAEMGGPTTQSLSAGLASTDRRHEDDENDKD